MALTNGTSNAVYQILDQVQCEPRHLKIIHVGAGASGLLAAYKAERMLENYELICYDKSVSSTSAAPRYLVGPAY